jgi:hypothetical protein
VSAFGWQDALAVLAAVAALAWLVKRRWTRRRSGCEDCPASAEDRAPRDFVALAELAERPPTER